MKIVYRGQIHIFRVTEPNEMSGKLLNKKKDRQSETKCLVTHAAKALAHIPK